MQIFPTPSRSRREGYALLIVLCFFAASAWTLAYLMSWTASSSKLTARNNQFLASQSAAEAADELVIATMTRDFLNQSLNAASAYTPLIPTNTPAWPVTYNFSDASGNANNTTVTFGTASSNLQPLSSQFARLQGIVQSVAVVSTATPVQQLYNVPATVTENIQLDTIPIFQFAIFYNLNMEICPGGTMAIKGPVYSNGGIWAGNANLTFLSSVESVGAVSVAANDPFANNYISYNTGPTFTVAPLTNQPSLNLPIGGTNNSAASVQNILNLPPAALAAPNPAYLQASNQSYIYNAADLIVSNSNLSIGNSYYGTNLTLYYENSNRPANYLALVTNDLVIIDTVAKTTNKFYSFLTNVSYYDFREKKTVQAVQIDVAKFNKWLTNNLNYVYINGILNTNPPGGGQPWYNLNENGTTRKGHNLDSIYVYNNVPLTASQLPAVRVVNGAQLPSPDGFTVATPQPLYVEGNYNVQTAISAPGASAGTTNTAYTYPAALMGDSITILSSNWVDNGSAYVAPGAEGSRNPAATTINAACLEGIVQSNPSISGNYSGGVENFLRLEEKWSGVTLTYNGSIIVMFYSQDATNYWQETVSSGNAAGYYDPPTRNWSFDNNFTQASKLPPLTPSVKVMLRTPGGWAVN
jgi:hypothetical protein